MHASGCKTLANHKSVIKAYGSSISYGTCCPRAGNGRLFRASWIQACCYPSCAGSGSVFVVRAFSKLSCGPCGLSSCAGGRWDRWGSPMAHGPWGSLSLVFAALSVCGALGGSCDRSLCSSVADDCCAPLSIGEAATCRNGYVAQRTGNGCFGYGEGDYTCCSTSASDSNCAAASTGACLEGGGVDNDCCAICGNGGCAAGYNYACLLYTSPSPRD